MSMAEFSAWIMFIWAMALLARHFVAHFQLLALLLQVLAAFP